MSPEGSGEPQRAEPVRAVCLAVEGFYPMGGTERQVVEIAVELHRRAIPVTVLCRWPVPVDNRYAEEWGTKLTDKGTLAPVLIKTGEPS